MPEWFEADFEIALQLASKLDFLSENSDNEVRRILCEIIFKQDNIRNTKIVQVQLNLPFALIAGRTKGSASFLSRQPDHSLVAQSVERAAVNR